KVGIVGAATGPNAQLGINITNGAKLAFDQYNATNPKTKITAVIYDTQGDPAVAPGQVRKSIQDKVVGVVGPAFSGESKAVHRDKIDPKASDYSSTVNKVKAAGAQAVFYGGYYAEAGKLLKQLRDAGVQAKFVSDDGSSDPGLIKAAGQQQADGAMTSCPC